MRKPKERLIGNVNESDDLEPEVIEFCHIVARILARIVQVPTHEKSGWEMLPSGQRFGSAANQDRNRRDS